MRASAPEGVVMEGKCRGTGKGWKATNEGEEVKSLALNHTITVERCDVSQALCERNGM